jgi:hypothetical protein
MPDEGNFSNEGEPTFSFVDGGLEIGNADHRMRIVGWPQPCARENRPDWSGEWRELSPTFRLVAPYRPLRRRTGISRQAKKDTAVGQLGFDLGGDAAPVEKPIPLTPAQLRRRAFDQFRFSLPKPVARALEKFRSHQWEPLLMLRHDPGAADLMQSNPVLGFALAHKMDGDAEMFAHLKVGSMRQRDILALLDLPDSAGAVKWMAKVPPESVTGESLRWVRQLFSASDSMTFKWMGHLAVLNYGTLRLLSEASLRSSLTTQLLSEVAESGRENYEAWTAGRLLQIDELRRQIAAQANPQRRTELQRLPRVDSLAELERLLRETETRWQETQRDQLEGRVSETPAGAAFPPPPVPGITGQIEPLTDAPGLMIEGAEQDNCVASYADRVRAGSTYIYRVKFPQRCTLSLLRGADGSWRIDELEFGENRPANGSTRDFVEAWLARYRLSAGG